MSREKNRSVAFEPSPSRNHLFSWEWPAPPPRNCRAPEDFWLEMNTEPLSGAGLAKLLKILNIEARSATSRAPIDLSTVNLDDMHLLPLYLVVREAIGREFELHKHWAEDTINYAFQQVFKVPLDKITEQSARFYLTMVCNIFSLAERIYQQRTEQEIG